MPEPENSLRVSIDEVLSRIFGEESAKLILQHIERSGSLTNPTSSGQALSGALRGLFGPGSLLIEREILKHLSSALESKSRAKENSELPDSLKTLEKECVC